MSEKARHAADLHLKMPAHHVYEEDQQQPTFEPPTPLRYNFSLPGDLALLRRRYSERTIATGAKDNVQAPVADADQSLSPSVNPVFYPALRTHTSKNSVSHPAISNMVENNNVNAKSDANVRFHVGTEKAKDAPSSTDLTQAVINRGLTAGDKTSNQQANFKKHSLQDAAMAMDSSRKNFLSSLFFGSGGNEQHFGGDKRFEVSHLDMCVIAPTSL